MEFNDVNVFENNKQLITRYVGVQQEDVNVLDSSICELLEAGVGTLKEITVDESDPYNWILLLTNTENLNYYLELSEYGSIIMLRKDGPEGEIIIDYLCDDVETLKLPDEYDVEQG